jgi:hypothetical protein
MDFFHHIRKWGLGFLTFLLPVFVFAETKTWTGFGGNADWSDPLNWSGAGVPLPTDDVLLDNREIPVSFQVVLPDYAVAVKTLNIEPSSGRNIELVLPPTNRLTNAFTVTGPGYGIELNAGAVFRNASGIASGESIQIADSIIIHDGGRYIHQTRASHANSILRFLSTAPGTEEGIFDFDVPRASYTISVSNRIYGSLELHAAAYGMPVNYICSGANPLLVRGNFRTGTNVDVTMDLSGPNGNMQIMGDFIQEGGQLNLASGEGNNTILAVRGDLYQSPLSILTETGGGHPLLELNGSRMQEITLAGQIRSRVGFRINNATGAELQLPLMLPWSLDMRQGKIRSSPEALLTLDTACQITVDSTQVTGTYVEGPLRKRSLVYVPYFLFPVGRDGNLRWLELKGIAPGNYTVEYIHQDPASLGSGLAAGLDHISRLEYWLIAKDQENGEQANIELSFATGQSGGVTDPDYLDVAAFLNGQWLDAGHAGATGNSIQGSVISGPTDLTATAYTLASTVNLENPLPLKSIELTLQETDAGIVFNWETYRTEIPDHYDLIELEGDRQTRIATIAAVNQQKQYSWTFDGFLKTGPHFYCVHMVDIAGREYKGSIAEFIKTGEGGRLIWISRSSSAAVNQILVETGTPDEWQYVIISIHGVPVRTGKLKLTKGKNYFNIEQQALARGEYVFQAMDSSGKKYVLTFLKE